MSHGHWPCHIYKSSILLHTKDKIEKGGLNPLLLSFTRYRGRLPYSKPLYQKKLISIKKCRQGTLYKKVAKVWSPFVKYIGIAGLNYTPGLNWIKTFCGACLLNHHFIKTEASLSTLSFIRTFLIGSFLK